MSRSESDYGSVVSLIEADGGEYWLEERSTGVLDDDGPVLVEPLTEDVRLEWVSLPEYSWYRVMAKDRRKSVGVPMEDVHRITSGSESPLRVLRGNITRRGLDEGWTRIGANSPTESESSHHGFDSLAAFREAAREDALALGAALSALLGKISN